MEVQNLSLGPVSEQEIDRRRGSRTFYDVFCHVSRILSTATSWMYCENIFCRTLYVFKFYFWLFIWVDNKKLRSQRHLLMNFAGSVWENVWEFSIKKVAKYAKFHTTPASDSRLHKKLLRLNIHLNNKTQTTRLFLRYFITFHGG